MNSFFRFTVAVVLLMGPLSSHAEEFIEPTPLSLVQTLFRFGALDINNDLVIDDYAKIAECDLYTAFHNDDFKWQKIRAGLRTKIRNEVVTYPANYYRVGKLFLSRYDFKNKTFKIDYDKIETSNQYVSTFNSFLLTNDLSRVCSDAIKMLPLAYYAVLETSLRVPGFVMGEADANALLSRMNASGNKERKIYAKFNLSVTYIDKIPLNFAKADAWYDTITWVGKIAELRMYSRLESIEYFEDRDLTRRIYIYDPNQ